MPLTPGSLSRPDDEGDRILVTPEGRCRWLYRQHDEIDSSSWSLADREHGLEPAISGLSEQDCGILLMAWLRGSVVTDAAIDKLLSRTAKPAGEPSPAVCGGSAEEDRPRPGSLSLPDEEGDRVLVGLDGRCRWLYKNATVGCSTWEPSSSPIPDLDLTGLSETQCKALLMAWPDPGVARATLDSLRRHAVAMAKPAEEPGFWQAAPRLGAREPIWDEGEDPVGAPPHYKLPGDREALEDVIAPICDALTARGLSGSTAYMVGNALKYLSRAGAKGSALEDLRKAREYLDRAIRRMDAGA